jgi:LacI family sucrose operon transcriptional repressor
MVDSIEKIMKNKIISSFSGKRKGIFCLSDSSAIVVLNYLFRTYGCLPEDYRIIGFDNTPASKEAVLPLSTVGQQVEILVDTAMSILLDEIRTSKEYGRFSQKDPVHAVIPPRLISRETTD